MELAGRREFKDFLKGIDAVDIARAQSPREVVEAMKCLSELKVYAYAFKNTGLTKKCSTSPIFPSKTFLRLKLY